MLAYQLMTLLYKQILVLQVGESMMEHLYPESESLENSKLNHINISELKAKEITFHTYYKIKEGGVIKNPRLAIILPLEYANFEFCI